MGPRFSPPELLQPSVASSTPSLGQQGPSMASRIIPLALLYPLLPLPGSSAEQPCLSVALPVRPQQHRPSMVLAPAPRELDRWMPRPLLPKTRRETLPAWLYWRFVSAREKAVAWSSVRKRTPVHSAETDSAVPELSEVEEWAALQNYRKAALSAAQQCLAAVRAEGSPRRCPLRATTPYPASYGRLQSDCPTWPQ